MRRETALISTEELAQAMTSTEIVLLDATFTMPGVTPDAVALYRRRHLPGAIFFDIDAIADAGALPHMLPAPAVFEQMVGALGIDNDSDIVIYDTPGMMSAARVWWTFRTMGQDRVRILDGGLRAWQAEGRPLTDLIPQPAPAQFHARPKPQLVRNKRDLLSNLDSSAEQVIDARSAARFHGSAPEPRPQLRSGHIPHSLNLPYDLLTDPATGKLRSQEELSAAFAAAGLQPDQPVVASCGSGVTAAVLVFALHLLGRDDVSLYDGSWAEWGHPGDTPIESIAPE